MIFSIKLQKFEAVSDEKNYESTKEKSKGLNDSASKSNLLESIMYIKLIYTRHD